MKANEFVRQYGWDEAAAFLSFDSGVEIVYTASFFDDLERLVESHELVEKRGGLSEARAVEQQYWNSGVGAAMIVAMELKQAILDVESCL